MKEKEVENSNGGKSDKKRRIIGEIGGTGR